MRIRSSLPTTTLLVLLVVGFALASVVTGGATAASSGMVDAAVDDRVEVDSVRLVVSLDSNGSATWTIEYWSRLDDENTSEAFDSLQSDIDSSPTTYSNRFGARMRTTVQTAENATGREMRATNVSVDARSVSLPQEYGVVAYSFRWHGFAAADADGLRAGDAIEGLFLDDRTRLVVTWPDEYELVEVSPTPDDRRNQTVIWRGGQTEFVSGEPSLVLSSASADAGGPSDVDGGDRGRGTLQTIAIGAVLLGGVAAAAFWWRRDGRGAPGTPTGADDVAGGGSEVEGTTAAGGVSDRGDEAGGDTDGASAAPAELPDELLSNEERVLKLLESRGGRIKQQAVASALDWTEAKTSQVVREMRDEGTIEGFRLGRENVLSLPDDDSE
ncbi:MAG: helix-turn-helix transcriptional regulator [Halobacteriota archaeon]